MITTDCHISPPFSLFDELPESYRQWFPRLEQRTDGEYLIQPAQQSMGGVVEGTGVKVDRQALMWAAMGACRESEPSFDPAEVLADLERDGVRGAVLINRGLDWDESRPIEVDRAYCELVNDWTAEAWAPYLDRVAPGIVLPVRDIAGSVAELERCAAKGMRPALLPDGMARPAYYSPEWEPMWEALTALDIPATLHIGTRQTVPGASERLMATSPYPGLPMVGWYHQCLEMGETLGHLVFGGVLERHPDLHVVLTEGYAGWMAFAMQFWDHHHDGRFRHQHPVNFGPMEPTIAAPPSYYIKRQVHVTFMWDPMAIEVRHLTGLDCLLWGNDYPHPEGSFPFSREWNDKQFAGVPEAEIDAIVRGNAAKLFKITV